MNLINDDRHFRIWHDGDHFFQTLYILCKGHIYRTSEKINHSFFWELLINEGCFSSTARAKEK